MSQVKVFIRVRPSEKEKTKFSFKNVNNSSLVSIWSANPNTAIREFMFDKVFMKSKQTVLFERVCQPIIPQILTGYNASIFAFGQTGSGKTHSIFGKNGSINGDGRGMMPRSIEEVFDQIKRKGSKNYKTFVSFYELYLSDVYDLGIFGEEPKPVKQRMKLGIREKKNGEIFVQNLAVVSVNSPSEVMKVVRAGILHRKTFETQQNEYSSRSHTIFTLTVVNSEEDFVGRLNFIDLAGSERYDRTVDKVNNPQEKAQRLKEHNFINTSLSALGRVILDLKNANTHVSYRASKLTRLLQNSLGGNSHTYLIATLNPAYFTECLETLKFAYRCKNVRNFPRVNYVDVTSKQKDVIIRKLQDEIVKLQKKIGDIENEQMKMDLTRLPSIRRHYGDEEPTPSGRFLRKDREDQMLREKIEDMKLEYQRQIDTLNKRIEHMKKKNVRRKSELSTMGEKTTNERDSFVKRINENIRTINELKKLLASKDLELNDLGKKKDEENQRKVEEMSIQFNDKLSEYQNYLNNIPKGLKRISMKNEKKRKKKNTNNLELTQRFSLLSRQKHRETKKTITEKEKMFQSIIERKDMEYKELFDEFQEYKSKSIEKEKLMDSEIHMIYEYATKLSTIIHKMGNGVYPIQMRFKVKRILISDEEKRYMRNMDILRYVKKKIPSVNDFIHEAELFVSKDERSHVKGERDDTFIKKHKWNKSYKYTPTIENLKLGKKKDKSSTDRYLKYSRTTRKTRRAQSVRIPRRKKKLYVM